MEIRFRCANDKTGYIELEIEDKFLVITCAYEDHDSDEPRMCFSSVVLDKNDLSDFIGQLLHIQSKFRNENKSK